MSEFSHPDLPVQMRAFAKYVEWAAGCVAVWINTNEHGLVREDEGAWCELSLSRFKKTSKEIRERDTGALIYPRQEVLNIEGILQIQANFKSRTQDLDDAAYNYATKAQNLIDLPYARQTFLTPNQLSLNVVGDVIDMPKSVDDRVEDIAVVEYDLNAVLTIEDSAAVGTYIEHIELTSNIKNVIGTSLDSSLQLDDEVIS